MSEMTLNTDDRVRVTAKIQGLMQTLKGTVIVAEADKVEVMIDGTNEVGLFAPESVEKIIPLRKANIEVSAGTGEIERTRALNDTSHVRMGTPEELLQLERKIRELVDEGHTYLFMEKWLMTNGYQPRAIRRAFYNITGIKPEDAVNINYQYSPGTIPQFTLAWGYGKKGKSIYFVMPFVKGYAIFHQIDDMNREMVVDDVMDLNDAIEQIKKLVKKLERWNPPVKENKRTDVYTPELYRQPQMFLNASRHPDLIAKLSHAPNKYQRESLIRTAFAIGMVDKPTMDELNLMFADAEEEMQGKAVFDKLKDMQKEEMDRPVDETVSEKTPQDYFEKQKMEYKYSMLPADVIASVLTRINMTASQMRDFSMVVRSFKYTSVQPAGNKSESNEPDHMNAIALVSVLLEIYDKDNQNADSKKLGLMVFSVISSQLYTTDTIKGEDDSIYALTDDGLKQYFQSDRGFANLSK